jgi:hypothetical protein
MCCRTPTFDRELQGKSPGCVTWGYSLPVFRPIDIVVPVVLLTLLILVLAAVATAVGFAYRYAEELR